jgi:signal transduction histidine kinase
LRVLLIEDDAGDTELIAAALDRHNPLDFHLDRTTRLAEGLARLGDDTHDVMVLDLNLPESTGLTSLMEVLDTGTNVPVVVLTGAGTEELGLEAVRRGAEDFLVKSHSLAALPHALAYAVERAAHRREMVRIQGALGELMAKTAHELRTPLTVIQGIADNLRSHGHDLGREAMEERTNMLIRQVTKANRLVSDLAEFSHLGDTQVALGPVDVAAVIAHYLDAVPPPSTHRVHLEVIPVRVIADGGRLEQILGNLLGNAYKYGGPNITVSLERTGDRAILTVADDGEGVPAEAEAQLFDSFRRGSNALGSPGFGLGLAVVHQLVTLFGGEVRYERGDPGSRFVVDLRLARTADTPSSTR